VAINLYLSYVDFLGEVGLDEPEEELDDLSSILSTFVYMTTELGACFLKIQLKAFSIFELK